MIGLDMDHTLVQYHSENFEKLVYEFSISALLENNHYPEIIKNLKFNYFSAINFTFHFH